MNVIDRLSELLEPTLPQSAYVVHGPRAYRRAFGVALVLLALAAASAVVDAIGAGGLVPRLRVAMVLGWLVFAGYGAVLALRRPEQLRIDDEAVRLDGVVVPWASVRQVVILRERPDSATQVGLRLKRGAPLPEGLDSLVSDPRDPLAIDAGLRSRVAGAAVDVDAVVVAVRAFAPRGVELLERDGDRERVLPG